MLDHLVLALLDEQPAHGFAIAKLLSSDDSLAAVMRVRRPLVYRSLNALKDGGLIRASKTEAGDQGSERTVYRTTARGTREVSSWLDSVVSHPRDARIELLAKFVCRSRRGLSNVDLAQRQRSVFEEIARDFDDDVATTTGAARLVAMWRHESVTSMITLLDRIERD
ncbi:MAG: PadR family transcriptional regulator [Actinomycetota bacterium]